MKKYFIRYHLTKWEIFVNTELLPLDVNDNPWLYEEKMGDVEIIDTGKWMLFYDKSSMNDSWLLAKKIFRENKLKGIISMKCSTVYPNPRASTNDNGVIILHCSYSSNEENIINIGKRVLQMFDYKESKFIYYEKDTQTREGTRATGSKINHMYKLFNSLYKNKCLIQIH